MDDLISRQAVLDLINADWKYEGLEEPINSLPPVTPKPSEDAISRREAISIASIATLSVNQVVTALEKLPSVNPQKPICPSEGVDPAYEKTLNKWIGAEVLDRIRNEMHATAEKHEDGVYYLRDEWVDEIIDKYAEGSDKE